MNRRQFLKAGVLSSATLAATSWSPRLIAAVSKVAGDPFNGLKVGITSYTLRKFTLDQAIAMTKQAGVRYISLKDMHLPLTSTTAQRQEARKKIEDAGLVLMGCGVVYLKNNEAEVRRAFEYARDAGMPTIISAPDLDALDLVEKTAKEFGIRVAIHNHGPGDQRYPSALNVLKMVKDRDALLGVCIDVGHTVRLGEDPVAVIEQCATRLYDFHIKDVTEATKDGKPIEVGRGVIDIVAVLKALLKVKFARHVALEYEANENAPMPGITESIGYIRGALAAMS
jgi:inosose dehydratase